MLHSTERLLLLTGFSVIFKTLALPLFSFIPFAHNLFQLVHPLFYLLAPGLYLFVRSMSVLVFLNYLSLFSIVL